MAPMKALIVGGEPQPVKQCHGGGGRKKDDGGTTHVFMDRGSPLTRGLHRGLWESAVSVKSCCRAHGKVVSSVSLNVF